MKEAILVIDQGTTGTTAAFFSPVNLGLIGVEKVEFPQIYPQPGWVEHRAEDIWQSVISSVGALLSKNQVKILAIGITNQRETIIAWNRKTGEVAGNAIVWQDRRTAARTQELRSDPKLAEWIFGKTGLVCDPYFSASKCEWILKNLPQVQHWNRSGELCFGTIDSYLIYRLTGGQRHVTDHTNASRMMLYDLGAGRFCSELCKLFQVPEATLPEILPSSGLFGTTKACFLPDGIPITGNLGDQQSALFGQGCTAPGQAKITFGTGAFLLMNTGSQPHFSRDGLLTTVAYGSAQSRTFALEGSAFIAGAAVQFLRDNFGWFNDAAHSEDLAMESERDPGLMFIPALAGLGAPYWNPDARGALLGLTRGASRAQITRAVLEGVALQNVQILQLMEQSGTKLSRVAVDGKMSRNNLLMQFLSDVLGVEIVRPHNIDTTATGAARAALLGIGHSVDPAGLSNAIERVFSPQMDRSSASKITKLWVNAVRTIDGLYRR